MAAFWINFWIFGFVLATFAFFIARRIRVMAVVDLIWTAGLGIAALGYALSYDQANDRTWYVVIILSLWSFRLTYHLFRDRVLTRHEDPRYSNLAKHWGERASRNFYVLFLAQVVFVGLFLLPVVAAAQNAAPGGRFADVAALLVALIALVGEGIADRQLAAFRANPDNMGKVCRSGLWRYSRHPNYFFEWLHWWAYVGFAWGSSNWWLSLLGPAAMYIFLRYLTGIPHAERSSLKRRGDAYRDYQQTTSSFFPWIPRQHPS